jgi:uncharacterized membrane protein YcgQ (UPF0703/DUF1980 family)
MTNRFTGLTIDEEERSTNNLSRKLEKMRRMQERNPTVERECKIQELESIVNPPKSIPKQAKKKKKKKSPKNVINDKKRINDEKYQERERKRQKKIEEDMERELRYQREKIEEERKEKERKSKKEEYMKKINRIKEIKEEFKDLPEDIIEFLCNPPDKKKYKQLSLIYHPDKGGNAEHFKIINNYMNK